MIWKQFLVKNVKHDSFFVPVINAEFLNAIESGSGKAAFIGMMAWCTIRLPSVPKYAQNEATNTGKCLFNFVAKFVSC